MEFIAQYFPIALVDFIGRNFEWILALFGIPGAGGILAFILKKYITKENKTKFKKWLEKTADYLAKSGKAVGVFVTLGLAKWKYTKPFWNKTIEPYVIIFLDLVVDSFILRLVKGFFANVVVGLKSDNPSYK